MKLPRKPRLPRISSRPAALLKGGRKVQVPHPRPVGGRSGNQPGQPEPEGQVKSPNQGQEAAQEQGSAARAYVQPQEDNSTPLLRLQRSARLKKAMAAGEESPGELTFQEDLLQRLVAQDSPGSRSFDLTSPIGSRNRNSLDSYLDDFANT